MTSRLLYYTENKNTIKYQKRVWLYWQLLFLPERTFKINKQKRTRKKQTKTYCSSTKIHHEIKNFLISKTKRSVLNEWKLQCTIFISLTCTNVIVRFLWAELIPPKILMLKPWSPIWMYLKMILVRQLMLNEMIEMGSNLVRLLPL